MPNDAKIVDILEDPESTPPMLYLALAEKYGPNVLDGEYAAIKAELEEILGHPVGEGMMNRLMAAINVMTNDFWQNRVTDFSRIVTAMATGVFDILTYRPPSVYEVAIATADICLLRIGYSLMFAEKVKTFVKELCDAEQYILVPKIINYMYDVENNYEVMNRWRNDKAMMDAIYAVAKAKADRADLDTLEEFQRFIDCAQRYKMDKAAEYAIAMMTAYAQDKATFMSFKNMVEAEKEK